ncbi:hypothetical protein CDD83_1144 [Cordyceps sp. RAO-2017]|nr:hypothetical protein CDD83_1144 [Cordyceps sp. RAO-2017]
MRANAEHAASTGDAEGVESALMRVANMREERAKSLQENHIRYHTALAEARAKAMARHRADHRHYLKIRAGFIEKLAKGAQQRKLIEARMNAAIQRMYLEMTKTEDMMITGYEGREADAKAAADDQSGDAAMGPEGEA